MKIIAVALMAPPLAILRYHYARDTAGPIGVFWAMSLLIVLYGLFGDLQANNLPRWLVLGFGIIVWLIAAAWARLVIGAVDEDLHHGEHSPQDHKVPPSLDETDPLQEVRKAR